MILKELEKTSHILGGSCLGSLGTWKEKVAKNNYPYTIYMVPIQEGCRYTIQGFFGADTNHQFVVQSMLFDGGG